MLRRPLPDQTIRFCFLAGLVALLMPLGCNSNTEMETTQPTAAAAAGDSPEDADAKNGSALGSVGQKKPQAIYSADAFRLAAHDGKLRVVEMCIEGGLDVNEADPDGHTPLAMASYNGHKEIAELLIKNKAVVDSRDRTGMTPLIHAASCPEPSAPATVKLLLDSGADIDAVGGDENWTALMMAAAEGNLEVVELLLAEGVDLDTVDTDGETAADFARKNGHTKVVELLEGK